MGAREPDRLRKMLRAIAALLMRSPDAPFILDDMDELRERDAARGLPAWRAWWRYGRNLLASAYSIWPGRRSEVSGLLSTGRNLCVASSSKTIVSQISTHCVSKRVRT